MSGLAPGVLRVLLKLIRTIEGQVLCENATMLSMCRQLGFKVVHDPDDPAVCDATLSLSANPQSTELGVRDLLQPMTSSNCSAVRHDASWQAHADDLCAFSRASSSEEGNAIPDIGSTQTR